MGRVKEGRGAREPNALVEFDKRALFCFRFLSCWDDIMNHHASPVFYTSLSSLRSDTHTHKHTHKEREREREREREKERERDLESLVAQLATCLYVAACWPFCCF